MTFRQFLTTVRARWSMILIGIGAGCALALIVSLLMHPKYVATASVVVDAAPDPVAGNAPINPTADYMQTQEDVATSERVAERVVTNLHLDQDPKFRAIWQKKTDGRGECVAWLAEMLRSNVNVPATPESNVFTIRARWTDGKFAATLANAFAQAYIDTTVELKMQPAKQYSRLFDESSRALRADVEAKQKALADYLSSHNLITDERFDIESARLTEISNQLVAVQAQLQDSLSRQQPVKGGDESRPEILQSQVIATLKGELAVAEAKEKELATELGANHPEYQRVQAEIQSLHELIARESAGIVSSLGATTQVNMRRETEIESALAAQKQRVLELQHQRDEAAVLRNEVVTAQRNLDAVTQRLAQSNLQAQTPEATTALLTTAREPIEPASPNYPMNLVIGFLLGAIGGVLAALFLERGDQRVRDEADLESILGVPLLGRLDSVPARPAGPLLLAGPNHS